MNALGEILNKVHKYLLRDLLYVFGGSLIIISLIFVFGFDINEIPLVKNLNLFSYFIIIGVAYIFGYSAQKIFSTLRLVSTAYMCNPSCILKFLYKRLKHQSWIKVEQIDRFKMGIFIHEKTSKSECMRDYYERIVFFKQIGTTVGSSGVICAFILTIKYIIILIDTSIAPKIVFLISIILMILVSIMLIILGYMKAMEQTQWAIIYATKSEKNPDIYINKSGEAI
ncbi:hypothetical protein KAU33_01695 [Candidatus Dependentiae bacterium]|nr:hypothetical protein [Candidatus Dependentiae bacterium]